MSKVKDSVFIVNEIMKLDTNIHYPDNVQKGMDTGTGYHSQVFTQRPNITPASACVKPMKTHYSICCLHDKMFLLRCFKNSLIS